MTLRKSAVGSPGVAEARDLVTHLDRTMRRLVLAGGRREAPVPLSRSEIAVFDTLGAEGPLSMSVVAARTRMPLSTATRVVDRLVARDLVRRERPDDNRRIVRVALTGEGRRVYRGALAERTAGVRRMLQCLTAAEGHELIRLFRKISDAVAAAPGEPPA